MTQHFRWEIETFLGSLLWQVLLDFCRVRCIKGASLFGPDSVFEDVQEVTQSRTQVEVISNSDDLSGAKNANSKLKFTQSGSR